MTLRSVLVFNRKAKKPVIIDINVVGPPEVLCFTARKCLAEFTFKKTEIYVTYLVSQFDKFE